MAPRELPDHAAHQLSGRVGRALAVATDSGQRRAAGRGAANSTGWWNPRAGTDWADLEATEAAARLRLPEEVYDYFAGGAGDETTLAANVASWRQRLLAPHVLHGVSGVDAGVEVLGCRMTTPIAVAPMGLQRMAHPDGEIATAAAAAATGTVLSVSTYATSTVEEVAAAGGVQWFQAYVLRDRGLSRDLERPRRSATAPCC